MSNQSDSALRAPSDSMLRDELDKLEKCLATPVAPGELLPWLEVIDGSLAQAGGALRRQVAEVHPALFKQISQVELELRRNVEQLRVEDQELLRLFDELQADFGRLGKRAAKAEPDEAAVRSAVSESTERGLWFVVRARKQETAIQTWLLEAFNRENGSGD